MALYVLFENENTVLFLYFIWILLNLQICQIILPDPVVIHENVFFIIWTIHMPDNTILNHTA